MTEWFRAFVFEHSFLPPVLLVGVLLVLGAFFFWVWSRPDVLSDDIDTQTVAFRTPAQRRLLWIAKGFVALIALLFTSSAWLEYSTKSMYMHSNVLVVTHDDDGNIEDVGVVAFCWDNCFKVPTVFAVESAVNPITTNPKVRHLTYMVEVKVVDVAKVNTWAKLHDHPESIPEARQTHVVMGKKVRYCLYEFNNKNSKWLADFYNPMDDEQTKKLDYHLTFEVNQCLNGDEHQGLYVDRLVSWDVE